MPRTCCEFVDSRLRRSPPDRASAVPYGQAGENAARFPHLAHRSAAAHKLHSTPQQDRINLISGNRETSSRLPALAYSPRKLSRRPAPSQPIALMCGIFSFNLRSVKPVPLPTSKTELMLKNSIIACMYAKPSACSSWSSLCSLSYLPAVSA